MNLKSMFAAAKTINTYNDTLQNALPPPLNQIKIVQITLDSVVFGAKNQSILTFAKGNSEILLNAVRDNLSLDISRIEIKLLKT